MQYLTNGLASPQDREVVADSCGCWTCAELSRRTHSVVDHLWKEPGWQPGSRVGVFLPRRKESVALFLGVIGAGGIAVPCSVRGTPREIAHSILDAGISFAVSDKSFQPVLSAAFLQTQERGLTPRWLETAAVLEGDPVSGPIDLDPESAALILYTSGTTGLPKGVVHTNASLFSQVDTLSRAWEWSPADRLLHVLPLHHIHGLVNGLLGVLWAGAGLRFLDSFTPVDLWNEFDAGRATVFYAVPTIYHQLIETWERAAGATQERWSAGAGRLRLAVSGSAALPARLWHRWQQITGQTLLERYGMTEIGMAISNPYRGERRPGTVGQPLPGMHVRIVTESGADAPDGVQGEIWVQGRSLFREYWNQPAATRDAFRDGYFRTGDIADVENGSIRILGRASVDILKSAGYKLSALEIEEVLREHSAVREVAVIGVPDPQWGEVVTACVVVHPGASLTVEQVHCWCQDKLAPYKIPRRLEICDDLPRNALGKVTKPALIQKLIDSS
jgi:malonyl-CoA/methylmalonyl-CoA synthetase